MIKVQKKRKDAIKYEWQGFHFALNMVLIYSLSDLVQAKDIDNISFMQAN